MATLSYRDYLADRDAARAKPRRADIYPRLMVLGSTWVRQDFAGGPMEVLPTEDVERLLLDQGEVA